MGTTPSVWNRHAPRPGFASRRAFLKRISAAGLALAGSSLLGQTASGRLPNVVVIFADDLGWGDLGCYGSAIPTPNLDRMAAEGMRLTQFYAAPVCTASRAQILTGCYAKRVSMGLFQPISAAGLNPEETTLAGLLRPRGYATMAIGKWHLGDQKAFLPTKHGFEHFFGIPYSHNMVAGYGKFKGKPPTPPLPLLRDETVVEAPVALESLGETFTREAETFIAAHKDRPFFLYYTPVAPHTPLTPGPAWKGKTGKGDYADFVAELDDSVGRILSAITRSGIAQDTLVVFTSDNGPPKQKGEEIHGSAGPLRGFKFGTFEGGVRVPGIFWRPGWVPAGVTRSQVASTIDLLPTVAAMTATALPPKKIDGKDMGPLLRGTSMSDVNDPLYYGVGEIEAVRSGKWKLFYSEPKKKGGEKAGGEKAEAEKNLNPPLALFDLEKDPGETMDVAADNPDVVARLKALMVAMDGDLGLAHAGPGVRAPGRVTSPVPILKEGW